jgi:tetratricopeptide (TPR) repeat protein
MLVPLFLPATGSSPDPSIFITPQIDGRGSVMMALNGAQLERAVFPYVNFTERSTSPALWPSIADVLYYEPSDLRVRKAIVGEIYASTAGNLDIKLRDTGLEAAPPPDKLQGIETVYQSFMNDPQRSARGWNGLAAMLLVRSLSATPQERVELERLAIGGFQSAIEEEPATWQFTYNWALANLLAGNYAQAYEGFKGVVTKAQAERNLLPPFWMGLAALRGGDPGEAVVRFTEVRNIQIPAGGNQAFENLYNEVRRLGRQGLGDAQWANRDVQAAYNTYFETLRAGEGNPTLYSKWLLLGLQQRGYEGLLEDLNTLAFSPAYANDARVHHDRARLLTFLGRHDEAMGAYRHALKLGGNDPGLHVSYGQALLSTGDHNGALVQAQEAVRGLGKDPASVDLTGVARTATMTNTTTADLMVAQQLLDANLLRARAWGARGDLGAVQTLLQGIVQGAGMLPASEAGLLHLYAGFAAEAAGVPDQARQAYAEAWQTLKGLPAGSPGRAAALAGLARTTAAATGNPQAGLELLATNGYDPAEPRPSAVTDADAPDVLYQGALLLQAAGRHDDAANAMRVAAIAQNLQDARLVTGVGRPLWSANGTNVPAGGQLAAADALREGPDRGLAVMRYKAAYGLDPALAAAWNNLGVLYARTSDPARAQFYLSAAGRISPHYALGHHNLATFAYAQGPGGFFTGEAAQAAAIKAYGPQSLLWGFDLHYDERPAVPAPAGEQARTLFARLPAIAILLLLLLHTIVGYDRYTTGRTGLLPTTGVLGRLGTALSARLKAAQLRLAEARRGPRALTAVIVVPSLVGMLALAWDMSRGSLGVLPVFLPVALLACAVAFGANELAQYLTARRTRGATLHQQWPLGVLMGLLGSPLGFVYGWQIVTKVQPAVGSGEGDGSAPDRPEVGRRTKVRTMEDLDLAYEAQVEALADRQASAGAELGAIAVPGEAVLGVGRLRLSPAARILLAGLAANLALGLLFGLVYWFTGWPSMRAALFASMLVLAFTGVSEPPADGWALYRRNPALWLAMFLFTATVVTLLAVKAM